MKLVVIKQKLEYLEYMKNFRSTEFKLLLRDEKSIITGISNMVISAYKILNDNIVNYVIEKGKFYSN
ncbi:hypothetical protein YG5714_2205 [Sulfolobus islandicus Y.G.57.14]|jgi:hypothetical protein|uniref:Uncharacterized protein n=6 Tax=Saccharolobus islandicus TaxID=43080 RepID=M9UB77_SACIS|nr:hypothetical protein [Sulfolobus islandicus]ACP46455.1 hypothetical protein YG5714_2205 [Sulfolobus islandicus Y.G.57.14]ACP47838.1 hypothetical protein YN1551_0711 [Sulfolobus islandicus Y.N.15.51]ADB87989.1 hypothetical protein LD85_2346 [Sulfolobus islandicus L.D.8.5]ADX83370.1 hypothetical protein SiH_2024 [Sulfolobus islandicus HVE10/4]ADX86017.1 hypothetical protein SiRe_1958 [Sulfolobus islandicus REY15A]